MLSFSFPNFLLPEAVERPGKIRFEGLLLVKAILRRTRLARLGTTE
jgi:hypothetical protein